MEFAPGRSGHGDGSESSAAEDEGRLKEETVEVKINSLLLLSKFLNRKLSILLQIYML